MIRHMRITKRDTNTPASGSAGTLHLDAGPDDRALPKPTKTRRPGLRRACAAFLLSLAFGAVGCAAGHVEQGTPSTDVPTAAPRFLALGDSYTIGESVAPAERWPVQLVARLRADGVAIAEPHIIARTGWTTNELDAAIDAAKPQGPYDLVSLLAGVNDQYRGGEAEAYRGAFRDLLRRAIDFAGGHPGRVIVVSIPDWGVTPFAATRDRAAITAAIDRFNAVNRDEAVKAGVRYVDVTAISRRAAQDSTLLAPDGLHPSGSMYSEWVSAAFSEVRAALESPSTRR